MNTVQLLELQKLAAMARVVEEQALAGVDLILAEIAQRKLFPPTGPTDDFGDHQFDLRAAVSEARTRLAGELRHVVGTVGEWSDTPADAEAITP